MKLMTLPIFDHERLDVYRIAIDYVLGRIESRSRLNGPERHARDQWLSSAQSIPLNIAEGNGKQSLKTRIVFFEIARGSALECAAIHDVLFAMEVVDSDLNQIGKMELKRIVAMLTRLIQKGDVVLEVGIELRVGGIAGTRGERDWKRL